MNRHNPTPPQISDDLYFSLVMDTALKITGRRPHVLRNPWTGKIFWVEGMHNCPRDVIAEAAAGLDALDERSLLNAVLH